MEYNLTVNNDTKRLEVEIAAAETLKITIGETHYTVDYALVSDHQVHLNVNGARLNAFITGGPEGKVVWINGISYLVQDADLATQSTKKKGGNSNLPSEVTPLTPSVVVALLVKQGDTVTKGQGVIVLSAMKMETTLNAPYPGTVLSIHTEAGAKVAPGDILVEIEKTEQESETEASR